MSERVVREIRELLSLSKEDEAQLGALRHYLRGLLEKLDLLHETMNSVATKHSPVMHMGKLVRSAMQVWIKVSRTEGQQDKAANRVVRKISTLSRVARNKNLAEHFDFLKGEFNIERNQLMKALSRYSGEIKEKLDKIKKEEEPNSYQRQAGEGRVFFEIGQKVLHDVEDFEGDLRKLIEVTGGAIATLRQIEKSCPKVIDLLYQTHEHPNAEEILAEASREHRYYRGHVLSFVDNFKADERARRFLRQKLQGTTLVDLGCGDYLLSRGRTLAKEFGVSTYLGVDKAIKEGDIPNSVDGMKIFLKSEDMLVFVSKLPNNSANFMIHGIDRTILQRTEYVDMLIQEISRAIKEDGVFFGGYSEPILDGLRRSDDFENMSSGLGRDCFLFVKK